MVKKLLHLIPATLLLLCLCCNASNPPVQNSPPNDSSQTDLSGILPESTNPLKSDSPYWDTEDVDVSDVDINRKLISFTFDDAPAPTLERIFAVFAAYNEQHPRCPASATLFFNGAKFDAQTPHLLHAACALGFELGNHTHSHRDLTTLTPQEITVEIDKTDKLLQAVDGRERHLLRAPFGRVNEEVKALAPTPLIDWTIDTRDWTGRSADEIVSAVWQGRYDGAIVLMHDGYEHTMSALKTLLPALEGDGYQIVSVSKMIKAHGCKFENGKVYIRARKGK